MAKESCRIYYQSHKEQEQKRHKLYYKSHHEEIRARAKLYYESHPLSTDAKEKRKLKNRLFRQSHKEQIREYQDKTRIYHIEQRWQYLGLNLEDARRVYKSSDICAICKEPISGRNKCLDHDHKTLRIRGILCSKHNKMLGVAQDNLEILQNSINYLTPFILKP